MTDHITCADDLANTHNKLAEAREALRDIRIRTGEKKVWRIAQTVIAKMEKNDG